MIIGAIATIPAREPTLKQVIDSIVPQVDLLYVVLNGHIAIPPWLREISKIKYVVSNNKMGDAMKFAFCERHPNVYYLTFDDDLVYPEYYVNKMVGGVDKYNSVVSLHGRIYSRPIGKFYKPRISISCRNWFAEDILVDLVGTGVCAFHTSRLKVTLDDFLLPNMADVWFSKLAWEQGVPLMVLEHHSYTLKYLPQKKENTIWHTQVKTMFEKQTEIIKTFLK